MVSERTLRKWRREALTATTHEVTPDNLPVVRELNEQKQRVIELTQVLLDLRLMRKI